MIMKGETFFISSTKTITINNITMAKLTPEQLKEATRKVSSLVSSMNEQMNEQTNKRTIKITNIKWDTIGEAPDYLPTKYIYEPDYDETIDVVWYTIANLLSDEFGWSVCDFDLHEEWS